MIKSKVHNPLFRRFLFLLVFTLITSGIYGEEAKEEKKPEKTIKATINMGLDVTKGNTAAFGVNADMKIDMVFDHKTEITFLSSISYLETDGEKKADKMDCTVLYDQVLTRGITLFLIAKPSKNRAQEIDFRLETGGGFKVDIIDNYDKKDKKYNHKNFLRTDLSLSAAVLYELTNRFGTDKETLSRLSVRPRLKQKLSENLELKATLFYQPSMQDFTDYRVLLETSLQFRISGTVSYLFKFLGEYNNVVPAGIEKKDYRLLNQLSISM